MSFPTALPYFGSLYPWLQEKYEATLSLASDYYAKGQEWIEQQWHLDLRDLIQIVGRANGIYQAVSHSIPHGGGSGGLSNHFILSPFGSLIGQLQVLAELASDIALRLLHDRQMQRLLRGIEVAIPVCSLAIYLGYAGWYSYELMVAIQDRSIEWIADALLDLAAASAEMAYYGSLSIAIAAKVCSVAQPLLNSIPGLLIANAILDVVPTIQGLLHSWQIQQEEQLLEKLIDRNDAEASYKRVVDHLREGNSSKRAEKYFGKKWSWMDRQLQAIASQPTAKKLEALKALQEMASAQKQLKWMDTAISVAWLGGAILTLTVVGTSCLPAATIAFLAFAISKSCYELYARHRFYRQLSASASFLLST